MTEQATPTRIWTTDTLQRAEMYVTTKPVEGGDEYVHVSEVEKLVQIARAEAFELAAGWAAEAFRNGTSRILSLSLMEEAATIREVVKNFKKDSCK